jgi:hypothetical protein
MVTTEQQDSWLPIEPPLPSVFSGNFLGDWVPEKPLADNLEVVRFLSELALQDLGGKPITGPSEEGDEILAKMMAAETAAAIERAGRSSLHWYTDTLQRAFAVAATMHPEVLVDAAARPHAHIGFRSAEDARLVLIAAMAITSQNMVVQANMKAALEQYRHFLGEGRFLPKAYGAKGKPIMANLERFNLVLEALGGDLGRMRKLLTARFTMGEFRKAAEKFGIRIGGKELVSEAVYGSMLFGPKIGNFMQNLLGNHEPVTIDLWFMRTWGRYTGTLVGGELPAGAVPRLVKGLRRSMRGKRMAASMAEAGIPEPGAFRSMDSEELVAACREVVLFWERMRRGMARKGVTNEEMSRIKADLSWPGAAESVVRALGAPVDSPRTASTRRWIRSVVFRALEILKDSGYEMTAADMQACLWYPEKELYDRLTGRPVGQLNLGYDEAMSVIARQEGIPDDEVERALRSVGTDGLGRRGGHGAPRRGDAGADPRIREGVDVNRGDAGGLGDDHERGMIPVPGMAA